MSAMSRIASVCWVMLALFLLPQATSAQEFPLRGSSAVASDNGYQLGSGDKIRVRVFGEDDLGGEFQVDGNGRISLPLIGELQAAGETAATLEQQIAAKLADGYLQDPKVSVEITTYRPFYVIGEVNRPGEYPYVNGMSALNAIALAGGYTEHANEGPIYVRRNGSVREEKLEADQMTRIYPGDTIRVPISPFWAVMSVVSPLAGAAYVGAQIAP